MTAREMIHIVQQQLALDLNCVPEDLKGEQDMILFRETRDNPGRRPFPRGEQHFEMLSMGRSIVVSATPKILEYVKPLLQGKGRDEAFSLPFICGHSLYYLPDLAQIQLLAPPEGYSYETVEQEDIPALYRHEGFQHGLQYDPEHLRPDVLASLAKKDGFPVGIAGASRDCAMMWQVGMDVLPSHRGHGLASYLISRLTLETLHRGFVPYYETASSNIASQRVAHRAGFYPAWMCAYSGRFGGLETLPTD